MKISVTGQSQYPKAIGYITSDGSIFIRCHDDSDRAVRFDKDGVSCDFWEEESAVSFLYPGDSFVVTL